jgi:hypothetical protein
MRADFACSQEIVLAARHKLNQNILNFLMGRQNLRPPCAEIGFRFLPILNMFRNFRFV